MSVSFVWRCEFGACRLLALSSDVRRFLVLSFSCFLSPHFILDLLHSGTRDRILRGVVLGSDTQSSDRNAMQELEALLSP